ncbi:MAG: MFS transporter [Thermogemmatispora sp.]|uniref:MFS transporter n=1 Tax=Thermogemmatispora sp. TaxID=1968838 RepID=UPI0019EE5903|nr:MFS transporter [Thermogemmatispora sp.]MBE3564212.1 MFS transporter [Thermogemmatispora sp.]
MLFTRAFSGRSSLSPLRLTLFSITLLEEMLSGIPTIGLPLLRHQVPMTYTQIGLLFTLGAAMSMVLEPLSNVLSDLGKTKKIWVIGGLLVLSGSFVLAGLARSFAVILLAFALLYPSNDIALGAAQSSLIDENPHRSTRTMLRLAFIGNLGDFLTPLTVTIIALLALGWASLCWLAAAIWLVVALFSCALRFPQVARSEGRRSRLGLLAEGFVAALRNPLLLGWVVIATLPVMLDEVYRSFASLYLQDTLHLSDDMVESLITFESASGFAGLVICELLLALGLTVRQVLAGSALVALIGMTALLLTHSFWLAGLLLCVVGASSISWFPLARAQVYERLPGRSGTGRALLSLGTPFSVVLPSIVGLIAGRLGITAGVAFLELAPLGILLLLLVQRAEPRATLA